MSNDFFENINRIDLGTPEKGKLLLSEPFLMDPNFSRTVVLLTEHNEEGSVGFVLNRPLKMNINEVVPDFPVFDAQLYVGGPVENNNLFYIHTLADKLPDSIEIMDGLWWGGDFDILKTLIDTGQATTKEIRFFAGYSGWAPDQLTDEMKQRSWIVSDATVSQVMAPDVESLWKNVMSSLGKKYKIISNFPEDPTLN